MSLSLSNYARITCCFIAVGFCAQIIAEGGIADHTTTIDSLPASSLINTSHASDTAQKLLRNGENFYHCSLFHEAIPCYEKANHLFNPSNHSSIKHRTLIRLCQCHLLLGNYQQVSKVLEKEIEAISAEKRSSLSEEEAYLLYLKAFSLRNLGHHSLALKVISPILNIQSPIVESVRKLIQLEEIISLYEIGAFEEAKMKATQLTSQFPSEQITDIAKVYTARIELALKNYRSSEKILSALWSQLNNDDPMRMEVLYLRGIVANHLKNHPFAIASFEELLQKLPSPYEMWNESVYEALCNAYICVLESSKQSLADLQHTLDKASTRFKNFSEKYPSEQSTLAQANFLIVSGKLRNDPASLKQAEAILSSSPLLKSKEAQLHALILRAQASTSYVEREALFEELTRDMHANATYYPFGWYYRGQNDYNHAHSLLSQNKEEEALIAFERSSTSLEKALTLFQKRSPQHVGETLLILAEAVYRQGNAKKIHRIYEQLLDFLESNRSLVEASEEPSKYFYVAAYIAMRLYSEDKDPSYSTKAKEVLQVAINEYPGSRLEDTCLYLMGTTEYMGDHFEDALQTFQSLVANFPHSTHAGNAMYWCGRCVQKLQKPQKMVKEYFDRVYHEYPSSKYAAEAYFYAFSYQDYLQGNKEALKHLNSFKTRYPRSPYVLHAHFLKGLDYKRDRKTADGKWLSKKKLTKAIEEFYNVELAYENLLSEGKIPNEHKTQYQALRFRSTLERAIANFAIAEESEGAKKQIYLEYAETVFSSILDFFHHDKSSLASLLNKGDSFSAIFEESSYGLARTRIKSGNLEAAKETLSKMIDIYQQAKITRGYFLSRGYYDLAMIAIAENHYKDALGYFSSSEDAGRKHVLTTDQKLDLWIQMSETYRKLEDLDKAMSMLSKVINEDAISGQRLKAMYLRATIYAQQGRHELARKQLEATSKMGGEWAKKAQDKLVKDYGYQNISS